MTLSKGWRGEGRKELDKTGYPILGDGWGEGRKEMNRTGYPEGWRGGKLNRTGYPI